MKIICSFILLLCINSLTLLGQSRSFLGEVYGGLNKSKFFDYRRSEGHFDSEYKSGYGYAFGLAVDRIKVDQIKADWMTLRLTLNFEHYGGEVTARDGGNGGGNNIIAKFDKSILSLGVFPIYFRLYEKIDLNFGFEIGGLIAESYSGTTSGWQLGKSSSKNNLKEKYNHFGASLYFGLKSRIACDLPIKDFLSLSPQCSFYYGLSSEMREFPYGTKSLRVFYGIGLKKILYSKSDK